MNRIGKVLRLGGNATALANVLCLVWFIDCANDLFKSGGGKTMSWDEALCSCYKAAKDTLDNSSPAQRICWEIACGAVAPFIEEYCRAVGFKDLVK